MPDHVISYFFKQIFVALKEFHKNYLTHSDIKADNIFIHYEGDERVIITQAEDLIKYKFKVVVGDLGLATPMNPEEEYQ